LTEAALALPVLVALVALVVLGAQLLGNEIALTGAARAGAVAAAAAVNRGTSTQKAAQQAASQEGIPLVCSGAGVPTGCVSVTSETGPESGVHMEVVVVYYTVRPWWRFGGVITLQARAAAAP
jgi:Flp pilus assembly protein TadG